MAIYATAFKNGLKPDPDWNIAEWSDERRFLAPEGSKESGRYRSSRTPYMIEPMIELSPSSPTEKVVFVKPTQIGSTEIGTNLIMAVADLWPGPCLFVLPTEQMAKKHSKRKVAPAIKHMPCLQGKIKEVRSRDSGNTILEKEFPGGSWTFSGSNSPVAARHASIRYLVLDDLDGFEVDVGGEGDPVDLFSKRTDSYGNKRKIYLNSTPTDKETSSIDREYKASSQGLYYVPCPHCGKLQFLEWGGEGYSYGIKFKHDLDKQITDIWYVCKFCKKRIEEHMKTDMMEKGQYIHQYPKRKVRGFKVNSLYSPVGWVSWSQIAEEFLKAQKNRIKLKVWVNTRLADAFEEKGTQPEWGKLKARCEPYKYLTVPKKGLFLSCGVDTQDDRLAVVVKAWGRGEENWLILWEELYGDPNAPKVWEDLDVIIYQGYKHESGIDMRIISAGVDSAGHRTQAVYNYCRSRGPVVFALKGSNQRNRPVVGKPSMQEVTWEGEIIKDGIQLWNIGTDTAKGTIYGRLEITQPGPGCYHWPVGLSDDYFMQLTAEKLVTKFVKGFPRQDWVKVRERNEALDIDVYSYAAAIRAGITWMDWDGLEASFEESKPEVQEEQPKVIKLRKSRRW